MAQLLAAPVLEPLVDGDDEPEELDEEDELSLLAGVVEALLAVDAELVSLFFAPPVLL